MLTSAQIFAHVKAHGAGRTTSVSRKISDGESCTVKMVRPASDTTDAAYATAAAHGIVPTLKIRGADENSSKLSKATLTGAAATSLVRAMLAGSSDGLTESSESSEPVNRLPEPKPNGKKVTA